MINGEADVNWVKFTYPFNMTRSPAASICAGLTAPGCRSASSSSDPSTPTWSCCDRRPPGGGHRFDGVAPFPPGLRAVPSV